MLSAECCGVGDAALGAGLEFELDGAVEGCERAQAEEVHLQQADFLGDGAFKLGQDVVVLVLVEWHQCIQRLIGDRVVLALERLMGLILVAVSVEMMIRGLKALAPQLGQ